jgi:hypothetical protein
MTQAVRRPFLPPALDAAERAESAQRVERVLAAGWELIDLAAPCACRLFRRRCPRRYTRRSFCEYRLNGIGVGVWDHVTFWRRDGQVRAVVGQPYLAPPRNEYDRLQALARRDGLHVRVVSELSWWWPGQTVAVVVTRAEDPFPD